MPKFLKAPETKKVFKDKEARFEALVESSSKYNVVWKVNDTELISKAGVKIERDFKANKFALVVSKASPNFGKKIVCEAVNEHGSVSKTCELIILGKLAWPLFISLGFGGCFVWVLNLIEYYHFALIAIYWFRKFSLCLIVFKKTTKKKSILICVN